MSITETSSLSYGSIPTSEDGKPPSSMQHLVEKYKLALIFGCCLIFGPLNFILYKVAYMAYGEEGSFFVTNAVNVLYVIIGQIALWIVEYKGEITPEMANTPHKKYMIMASLDAIAGFLAGMGAVWTAGAMQSLLNQSLIPCTMLMSYLILGTQSSTIQIMGAIVILIGATVVLSPSLIAVTLGSSSASDTAEDQAMFHHHLFVVIGALVYAGSNLPYAISFAYKEIGFKDHNNHVIHLTQWVSIYQMLFGFILMPLQAIPGLGSEKGMTMQQSYQALLQGWSCFRQQNEACADNNAFLLLVSYCLVNFIFNLLGLYLVKYGSIVLNAISYAIILPLTVLGFCMPLMGLYQEPFNWLTIFGLFVVLWGFYLWKSQDISKDEDSDDEHTEMTNIDDKTRTLTDRTSLASISDEERASYTSRKKSGSFLSFSPRSSKKTADSTDSFQERVIILAAAASKKNKE